jgi:hypothetical protein
MDVNEVIAHKWTKQGITRIVNGFPEGTKPPREGEQDMSRRDAKSAEKTRSCRGQENLPDNISNIFG